MKSLFIRNSLYLLLSISIVAWGYSNNSFASEISGEIIITKIIEDPRNNLDIFRFISNLVDIHTNKLPDLEHANKGELLLTHYLIGKYQQISLLTNKMMYGSTNMRPYEEWYNTYNHATKLFLEKYGTHPILGDVTKNAINTGTEEFNLIILKLRSEKKIK